MTKVHISLFGCDKNRVDAEIMAYLLSNAGYEISDDVYSSDIAIINTCAFIESATTECIEHILELAAIRKDHDSTLKYLVVTGCLAERYKHEVERQLPELDAVVGLGSNRDIVRIIDDTVKGKKPAEFKEAGDLPLNGGRILSTPTHYAYLKIAEGCSNSCSYCVIPQIRGRYRSRRQCDILKEAAELTDSGVKELIIIAQDTTAYGRELEKKTTLAGLLRELVKIENLWKVRLLYTYPEHITDELIDTIAEEEKIAKYIDIPFQHANNEILKAMNRKGRSESYLELINRIRTGVKDIAIRSSFIVGFPHETKKQFGELIDFIKAVKLERAGCFCYSQEEGTPSGVMPYQISNKVKHERRELFMVAQSSILYELQSSMVNKQMEVITDFYDENLDSYCCRGEHDAPEIDTCVYVRSDRRINQGEILQVKVTATDGIDLFACEI